jgi:hypothetical protein
LPGWENPESNESLHSLTWLCCPKTSLCTVMLVHLQYSW